jgi:hypothetical protein
LPIAIACHGLVNIKNAGGFAGCVHLDTVKKTTTSEVADMPLLSQRSHGDFAGRGSNYPAEGVKEKAGR